MDVFDLVATLEAHALALADDGEMTYADGWRDAARLARQLVNSANHSHTAPAEPPAPPATPETRDNSAKSVEHREFRPYDAATMLAFAAYSVPSTCRS